MVSGERFRGYGIGAERPPGRDPIDTRLTAAVATFPQGRSAAPALVIVREGHAVSRRNLRGHTAGENLPTFRRPCLDRLISRVIPVRRVAGKPVREDPVNDGGVTPGAAVCEEPEAIALDRTAEAPAHIPIRAEGGRLRDPEAAQPIVDIVGGRPVARRAVERRTPELVSARFRHDIDAGPAGLGVTEAAGNQHLHFFRVGDVVRHIRHTATAERGRNHEAVGHQPPFAAGAAMGGEEHHAWRGRGGGCAGPRHAADVQRRDRGQRGAVAARRRQRVQRFVVQHDLPAH